MEKVYTLTWLAETRDNAPYVGVIGTFTKEEDAQFEMHELAKSEKNDFMENYECDEDDIVVDEQDWMIGIFCPKNDTSTTYEIHSGYVL